MAQSRSAALPAPFLRGVVGSDVLVVGAGVGRGWAAEAAFQMRQRHQEAPAARAARGQSLAHTALLSFPFLTHSAPCSTSAASCCPPFI